MAGNLPVPQGVEVKIVWHRNTEPHALTVHHFKNPQAVVINQALAESLDTAAKQAYTTSGLASINATMFSLHHIEMRSMVANSDPWFRGTGAAVPGTGAGNPLPAATSYVITLRTGLRGRSYNGRTYYTGFTEDANDAQGGISAAASLQVLVFANSWNSVLYGAPNNMSEAVLSRWTTPPGASVAIERNPPILTDISSRAARDLRWDVQRRRAVPGI